MRLIMLIALVIIVSGCSQIPWIGPLFNTEPVEEFQEEVLERSAEQAAAIAGEPNAHVEVVFDEKNNPQCMHCPFHCPKEATQ